MGTKTLSGLALAGLLWAVVQCGYERPPDAASRTSMADNLVARVRFVGAGTIGFSQDTCLVLRSSRGWVWGVIPDSGVHVASHHRLVLEVRTRQPGCFFLELKDGEGPARSLIGTTQQNGVWKSKIDLPSTDNAYRTIVVDLAGELRPGIGDARGKVLVLSDPDADVTVRALAFTE